MAHLGDKLAEFFYEELPATELAEARRHVQSCMECRREVEQFERTHLALKAVPDFDPPRHVVLSAPEARPQFAWLRILDWRSAAVAGAVAAVLAGVVIRLVPGPAPANYDRIVNEIRQSDRAWLAAELDKRDKEIQRLQGELAYYEDFQRSMMKETVQNASSIQLLAARR
jgi:anti-sigma factor RsiW